LRLFSGIRFSDPPERARCGDKKEQHIQENREQGEPHGAGTVSRRGCWVWNAASSNEGKEVLRCGDGRRPAPRLFWEPFAGVIPPNDRILSRKVPGCAGKVCCNPAHPRLQGPVISTELEFFKLGHPLSGDNVVVENRNGREFKRCRTCRREACRTWQRQKTAENKRAKSKPGKRSK